MTPALAQANNGNWQTAQRWARLLRPAYRVELAEHWAGGEQALLIALHARRSAASIAAWREAHPRRPVLLVLTGTDLYRDIAGDATAQRSLALADRLVETGIPWSRPAPPLAMAWATDSWLMSIWYRCLAANAMASPAVCENPMLNGEVIRLDGAMRLAPK